MAKLPKLRITRDGHYAKFHGSWYRGEHTDFIPARAELDAPGGIERYLIDGWKPEAPFIGRDSRITAFGSCFAEHISNHLHARGYNVLGKHLDLHAHIIRFGEGMVNSFAIVQQLEWALENKQLPENLWFGKDKEVATLDPEIRRETCALIQSTDVFVITLGLSEIWFDKQSGEAFWRAIPSDMFDPDRHGFRLSTVKENARNLTRIYSIISAHRPDAKLVLTLSPIPLMATFRPMPCLSANTISKAVLRVAIDMFLTSLGDRRSVHYFPSYEIVKEVLVDPFKPDNRHVKPEHVERIMRLFEDNYCTG